MKLLTRYMVGEIPKRSGTGTKRTKKMRRARKKWRGKVAIAEFVQDELAKSPVGQILGMFGYL